MGRAVPRPGPPAVASSVHRHYRTLRRVLRVAVEEEKLTSNPCDRVQPPRVPASEMVSLSWDEAVALAEADSERYRALIYLAVDTGMPWSEVVGLRRATVDLAARRLREERRMYAGT
jgi:integrase